MRRTLSTCLLAALFVVSQAAGPAGEKPQNDLTSPALRQQVAAFDTETAEPITVIVELSEAPAAIVGRGAGRAPEREARLNRIRTERGNVFSHLRRVGIRVSPRHEFELAYNGFSLTLPANQLPLLAGIPGIVGIHPNPEVERETIADEIEVNAEPQLANGVPAIRAPAGWAAGYRGAGVLIGILDDGVDYTHPDLGGCLGPGCKVIGGYDFIELDADPQEGYTTSGTPPVTTRDYHGTHVASIAAGAKGVAPDASILAVRVLGSGNRSALDTIMAGIEFAMRNDVDVINMSIGFQNTSAHSANPYAVMTGNVVSAGVVWVNSNGNDGASGPYRPNMYGASPLVIATGNADARPAGYPRTTVVATGEVLAGGGYFGGPSAQFPASLLGVPLDVVDVGFGNNAAYYAGKDVAGKIAIASRGAATGEDGTFVNKASQAVAAGAAALIVSNNAAGDFINGTVLPLPSFTVSTANGEAIRANPVIIVETFSAGPQVASGSSRGPTMDLEIKPDVSAPGTSVIAAVPYEVSASGYASLSGTSMASPHVAGAAVLLRQAHPDWTPAQVKLALMNTAGPLVSVAGRSFRTIEQGAGFVNVERALAPALTASPGSVSFGQLLPAGYTATRAVDVIASGVYDVNVSWIQNYPGASASASASQIAAGPHSIGLTVSIDPAAPAGEYEGYLTFTSTSNPGDVYRVPFLFVHAIPVTDFSLSKTFARSTVPDTVDVTFSTGTPLADWYLGSFPNSSGAHTRFTANQGPVGVGMNTYTWNVRSLTGGLVGVWSVGVWYRLPGAATFTFGTAYGRLYVDSTAPLLQIDAVLPSLINEREVTISGAVRDTGMWAFGEAGGFVLVNGERADLYPRSPAQIYTTFNNELAFDITITLAEGENTITVYAQDAAGNRSTQTIAFSTVVDTIGPEITFTGATTYTVDQFVTVSCTASDGGSGVATTTCGATPLLQSDAWRLPLGTTSVIATATDVAGNTTTAAGIVTVIVTHDSLAALTTRFVGGALGESLHAHLRASAAAMARGNLTAAVNTLDAFQHHVAAQAGKAIPADYAATLIGLAEALK